MITKKLRRRSIHKQTESMIKLDLHIYGCDRISINIVIRVELSL